MMVLWWLFIGLCGYGDAVVIAAVLIGGIIFLYNIAHVCQVAIEIAIVVFRVTIVYTYIFTSNICGGGILIMFLHLFLGKIVNLSFNLSGRFGSTTCWLQKCLYRQVLLLLLLLIAIWILRISAVLLVLKLNVGPIKIIRISIIWGSWIILL